MKDEALLKLALEALKKTRYRALCDKITDPAITALEKALAAPRRESVAWNAGVPSLYPEMKDGETVELTPPAAQRQWVGLTDEEMRELEKQFNAECFCTSDEEYLVIYPGDYWQWQRAIEAKLKEKNT